VAVITVDGLKKSFEGRDVLQGVSFQVDEGEIFGYLGPNGAGKTTTIRILLGLLRPTSGSALVWGSDLGSADSLRRRIGVLMENNGLYARLSAYENLDYYARIYGVADRGRRIGDLLDFAGLSGSAGQQVGTFSTGMKRKLALARAIVHDPALLFLDEPTSGLDPEAQRMVRDLIIELAREKNRTVFLNSHNLDEVERICTKVAILHQGAIRAYDSVAHLRTPTTIPTYEITVTGGSMADRACMLLEGDRAVRSCSAEGTVLTVTLEAAEVPRLIRKLALQGIEILEARREARSLEDVYLEVVHSAGGAV
jgi:ABC-2 type transport system ATP-binding protein